MVNEEHWLSLAETIDRIRIALKCAIAPAQEALISACEGGAIRSCHAAHYERQRPLLLKSDWRGADIELENDRVVKALGNHPFVKAERVGMKGVEFNESDLKAWIEVEGAVDPLPGQQRGRRFTPLSVKSFVSGCLERDCDATLDQVRTAACDAKYVGARELLDPEYRRQKNARGENVRPGRRTNAKI